MKKRTFGFIIAITMTLSFSANALQPGQSAPKRLYSIGDSITRAFDAYLPFDNKNLSWSNGYYGFWERLLNMPNIKSHHQRIVKAFGESGTENWMAADTGAETDQFFRMAIGVAGRNVNYTTVLLGANDVCADSPAALPSDAQFASNFRKGMDQLVTYLPNGATVLVAGIPDVEQVYQVGINKSALGLVNCKTVWSIADICPSMLSDNNTEADRQYVKSRNQGYNSIIANIVAEYQQQAVLLGKRLFIQYNDGTTLPFSNADVSDIDCFHPSELGQKAIAEETWQRGSFNSY